MGPKPQDSFVKWLYDNKSYKVDAVTSDHVAVSVVEGWGDGFPPDFWERAREEGYRPSLVNTVAEYAELKKDSGFDFGI